MSDDGVAIEVFRHYGSRVPSGDLQSQALESTRALISAASGFTPVLVAHGVVMGGGTPAYRWLEVTLDSAIIGLKILAADGLEAENQLSAIAPNLGVSVDRLSYIRPPGWPTSVLFPRLPPASG